MENMTLFIDPETRDLAFDENGMMCTIGDDSTSAQSVRLTLLVYKGEFELVPGHGTDYQRIMGKKGTQTSREEIDEVLREAILQEETVGLVESLEFDLSNRLLNVALVGELKGSGLISMEVTAG